MSTQLGHAKHGFTEEISKNFVVSQQDYSSWSGEFCELIPLSGFSFSTGYVYVTTFDLSQPFEADLRPVSQCLPARVINSFRKFTGRSHLFFIQFT